MSKPWEKLRGDIRPDSFELGQGIKTTVTRVNKNIEDESDGVDLAFNAEFFAPQFPQELRLAAEFFTDLTDGI